MWDVREPLSVLPGVSAQAAGLVTVALPGDREDFREGPDLEEK